MIINIDKYSRGETKRGSNLKNNNYFYDDENIQKSDGNIELSYNLQFTQHVIIMEREGMRSK